MIKYNFLKQKGDIMAWVSNVQHVTRVNSLFANRLYHALWEECDKRLQSQERFSTLTDTQRHIAADVALRTIATEREYGPIIGDVLNTPFMLLRGLHKVNQREKIFPTDSYPLQDQADLLALLETAGSIVYKWEQEHGRFPSLEDHTDFYLESKVVDGHEACGCEFYYNRGIDLPTSPFIRANQPSLPPLEPLDSWGP